jgi:hypothetical protein
MTVSPQKSNSTLESPAPVAARPHRKPQADLYTILLALALVAVLVAILFLYLYMKLYNNEIKGGPSVTMSGVQNSERGYAASGRSQEKSGRVGEWESGRLGIVAYPRVSPFSDFPISQSPPLPLSPSPRLLFLTPDL